MLEKHRQGIGPQWKAYLFLLNRMRDFLIGRPQVKKFLALSDLIYRDLLQNGMFNSEMMFPPARLDLFHPKPKKRQIVITCRIDPAKNLEGFFKIAEQLPKEKFLLVARDNETTRITHPQYAEKLFRKKPSNVEFVNSPIKNVPEALEESLVYLYTGIEPGIGIAIMEACGAGCIPMAPHIGGGGEIVRALGAGSTFNSYPDAVRRLKLILENPEPSPDRIREMALKTFGMEQFQTRIRALLT
jgi:glycosyltransferase involved in cell wall biosynthesis